MRVLFIALAVAALSLLLLTPIGLADVASGTAPSGVEFPRVIRYVSSLEPHRDHTCYGVVLEEHDGIPVEIGNLAAFDPALCSEEPAGPALIKRAFEIAERTYLADGNDGGIAGAVETLPQEDLGRIVKAAVAMTAESMIFGPWGIVGIISERYRSGQVVCMRDAHCVPRFIHNARGIIPAGSVILAGTPAGTAIKEPGILEKAFLFVTGGSSVAGAKRRFAAESEKRVAQSSYIEAGDVVEARIDALGRQRWAVVEDASRAAYGVDVLGECPDDARPEFC